MYNFLFQVIYFHPSIFKLKLNKNKELVEFKCYLMKKNILRKIINNFKIIYSLKYNISKITYSSLIKSHN